MAPTKIEDSSKMAVDSPHSTACPAGGRIGRGGRVTGEGGRGRGRRGGRSFKGGKGGNNPADTLATTLAFLKKAEGAPKPTSQKQKSRVQKQLRLTRPPKPEPLQIRRQQPRQKTS